MCVCVCVGVCACVCVAGAASPAPGDQWTDNEAETGGCSINCRVSPDPHRTREHRADGPQLSARFSSIRLFIQTFILYFYKNRADRQVHPNDAYLNVF